MDKRIEAAWKIFVETGDVNSYLNYTKIRQESEREQSELRAAWGGGKEKVTLR